MLNNTIYSSNLVYNVLHFVCVKFLKNGFFFVFYNDSMGKISKSFNTYLLYLSNVIFFIMKSNQHGLNFQYKKKIM